MNNLAKIIRVEYPDIDLRMILKRRQMINHELIIREETWDKMFYKDMWKLPGFKPKK